MKLFIDTNILLSFYHLTSEDIEELKKLVVLVGQKEIELLLTEQVLDEFYRNREAKINDALRKLKGINFAPNFPAFCKDYDEYQELREHLKEANEKHSKLVNRAAEDASSKSLKADKIIKNLFENSTILPCNDDLYTRAQKRVEIGNPPGKKGSLGDALNWECMLQNIDAPEALYFVSGDNDYASPLSKSGLHEFLGREWSKKTGTDLFFYRKISEFFKLKSPSIKLASEDEKDLLIQKLAVSGSFSTTHEVIAQLLGYTEFNIPQIEQLILIPEHNNQVGRVTGDPDLKEFYGTLLYNDAMGISNELRRKLKDLVPDYDDENPI